MRVGMSKEGHRNGRFEPVGATARTMWRGAMVEVLREGEEAGVELVVLVGLAESSCGDVGKAHAVRGPGFSRVVSPGSPMGAALLGADPVFSGACGCSFHFK